MNKIHKQKTVSLFNTEFLRLIAFICTSAVLIYLFANISFASELEINDVYFDNGTVDLNVDIKNAVLPSVLTVSLGVCKDPTYEESITYFETFPVEKNGTVLITLQTSADSDITPLLLRLRLKNSTRTVSVILYDECYYLLGDIDESGSITKKDIAYMLKYIDKYSQFSYIKLLKADYNNDGIIDLKDILGFSKWILG